MSSIFITNIVGGNDFAVPENDTELNTARTALDALLSTVAGLVYSNIAAWVTDDNGTGTRVLNCNLGGAVYNSEICPSIADSLVLMTLIDATLLADVDITTVGEIYLNLENTPSISVPAHASTHESGAADEIDLTGMTGLLGTAQTPAAHNTSHESGGGDELDLTGMTGLLGTAQTPAAHNTSHESGGGDELDLTGMTGLLGTAQTPAAHNTSHESGGGDELDLTGMTGLLGTAQTPASHNTSHESGGGDELDLTGMTGLLGTAQTPASHNTSHESGGGDELDLTGMTGLLGTAQTPAAHNTSHESGGGDELDLTGMTGLLGTAQTPASHNTSHESGGGDELDLTGMTGLLGTAQTPAAHHATHESGGADEITGIGKISQQQTVTVALSGGDYTSIASALAAITDAGSTKPYCIYVYPGVYTEAPLTLKSYVSIRGIDPSTAIIAASNNSSPLFTFAAHISISNLTIQGPTSDAACYVGAGIANVEVENCRFISGQTAVQASGSGASILVEESKMFPSVSVGLLADTSGVIDASNVLSYSTTAFKADGGTIWLHNSGGESNTNGLYALGSGIIYPHNVTFENTTYPIITGSGSNLISGNSVVSRGTSTYDVYQTASGSTITITGSRLDKTKFMVADWNDINCTYDTSTDDYDAFVCNMDMDVGSPEKGRHFKGGEGSEFVREMLVYTTDDTATSATDGGNLTDVSTAARSRTGSTFTFQGVDADHTILIGTTLENTSDKLKHWGLKVLQTTAAVEITPKSFAFEIWNGTAWAAINVMSIAETTFYRYGNEVFIRANTTEVIRYGINDDTTWAKKTIDGNNCYWARIRITSDLTTAPVFEQFSLSPSHQTIHETGFTTYCGLSRFRYTLQSSGNVFGEESGGAVADFSMTVGTGGVPTGWTHNVKNSGFNGNGDGIHYQFNLPKGIDTSQPLDFLATMNVYSSAGAGTASFVLSVLPIEVEGIYEADPTGGTTPVARTIANTETLAAKVAQTDTETLDTSVSTKLRIIRFFGFDVSDYYEGDAVLVRLEMDDDGASNSDIGLVSLEVDGVRWAMGRALV